MTLSVRCILYIKARNIFAWLLVRVQHFIDLRMILKSISWFVQHVIKTCKTVAAYFMYNHGNISIFVEISAHPWQYSKSAFWRNDFRIDDIVGRKPVTMLWSYKLNQPLPSIFLSQFLRLSLRLIDSAVYNLLHAYLVLTYNSLWIFYIWYYYIFCNFLWQITCFVHFIREDKKTRCSNSKLWVEKFYKKNSVRKFSFCSE